MSDHSVGTFPDDDDCFMHIVAASLLLPHEINPYLQGYCDSKEKHSYDDQSYWEVRPWQLGKETQECPAGPFGDSGKKP